MFVGTASATPKESKAYSFWIKAHEWEPDGNTSYGVPTVEVALSQVVEETRVDVELPESTAEYLLGVFKGAEEGDIKVFLDEGTIQVAVGESIGSASMEEYVEYYVDMTKQCFRALDRVEDAEALGDLFLDFDQDTEHVDELMDIVDEYRPIADEMAYAYGTDRCREELNDYEPDSFVVSQIEAAVRGILLGVDDIVHFSEMDRIVATRVLEDLYLSDWGFFVGRSVVRVKEALMPMMAKLSPEVTEYDERSYFNYFDFAYYASDFSVHDLLQIACSCVPCGARADESCEVCDRHFSFRVSLEECYQEGKIVFDTVKLSDEVRGFVRGGGEGTEL
jgi:hypothetical protein